MKNLILLVSLLASLGCNKQPVSNDGGSSTTPSPLDDNFNGTSFDSAKWNIDLQSTGTTYSFNGSSAIVTPGTVGAGSNAFRLVFSSKYKLKGQFSTKLEITVSQGTATDSEQYSKLYFDTTPVVYLYQYTTVEANGDVKVNYLEGTSNVFNFRFGAVVGNITSGPVNVTLAARRTSTGIVYSVNGTETETFTEPEFLSMNPYPLFESLSSDGSPSKYNDWTVYNSEYEARP